MISAHPHSSWPQQQTASRRRPLMTMAFVLISLSGLLSGLVLRPLTQSLWSNPNHNNNAKSAPVTLPPTATVVPTVPAENFYIGLKATPNSVAPGGTFTATATAKLSRTDGPAAGVVGTLTLTDANDTVISVTAASLTTDANGKATWTITVPATLTAGTYTVTVVGKWGIYSATWESSINVHSA